MENDNLPEIDRDDPMWNAAIAIECAIRTIRKARGKKNLEDCVPDTPEYEAVLEEFMADVVRALP